MSEPCGGRKRKNFESEKYEALMQTASANQLHAVLNVFEEMLQVKQLQKKSASAAGR